MFFNNWFDDCLTDPQLADKKLASIEHFDKLSVTEHAIFLKACQLTTYRLTDLQLNDLPTYDLQTYRLTDLPTYRLTTKKNLPIRRNQTQLHRLAVFGLDYHSYESEFMIGDVGDFLE